jgi:hypothetical protein
MAKMKTALKPGWKMTETQVRLYWRMFAAICEAKGWRQDDDHRREWHCLAGLGPCSAKTIDRMKGFDALKACWLAITQPANFNAQMAMQDQPRHRLITRIRADFPEAYVRCLVTSQRFKATCLEDLTEKQLIDLRNTLCARKPVEFERQPAEAPSAVEEADNVHF